MIRWNKFILAFLVAFLSGSATAVAQQAASLRRYVDAANGAYANDGLSWAQAKNNIQEAINDLAAYMAARGLTEGGEIFVAEGTYSPTEGTEEGSTLFASFKMSPGIAVYGGFPAGGGGIEDPADRPMKDGSRYGWQFLHETVLSGDLLASSPATFAWSDEDQTYTTAFPSNVYHVVWFATAGFDAGGKPVALSREAVLDGFTIKHGHAADATLSGRHYSRGGGVYLVDGGVVRNCIVTENAAVERGGGIYLDGGGRVESSFIHRNTAPGASTIAEGYGGGIALVGGGDVRYSMIVNNFAANGGGLALYNPDDGGTIEESLCMSAVASVVANNTASNEAGGVYLRNGGILNLMTVTANRCNGTGITVNNVQNGKSAGVYVANYGCILNSVFWGGTIGTDGYVQYYHRPDARQTGDLTSLVFHSAFSDQAITEWTYTYRSSVLSLERDNFSDDSNIGNYPIFTRPARDGNGNLRVGVIGDDAFAYDDPARCDWLPASVSPLREYGRRISDLSALSAYSDRLTRAVTPTDICGNDYSICPSLGAYRIASPTILTYQSGSTVALFVDPETNSTNPDGLGNSWETPLAYLNVALSHFRDNPDAYPDMKRVIYVKEGTVSPLCAYTNERFRSAGIQMVSGVEVRGGYAASLTGTDLSLRNPVEYRSVIDGKVGDDEYVYHCVVFKETSDAVLDGFHIINGDATPTGDGSALIKSGGGIVMAVDPSTGAVAGGAMTGNAIRNCIIENCAGELGGALYAAPATGADFSLAMGNCIINNNTALHSADRPAAAVYFDIPGGAGTVSVAMEHQTIVKNVGYAIYATRDGSVTLEDSWAWSNAAREYPDGTALAPADVLTLHGVAPRYCAFDDGAGYSADNNTSTLTYGRNEASYPACVNPTRNIGRTPDAFNTYNGGLTSYMPTNMNPVVNCASDDPDPADTDITTVNSRQAGGAPDLGAYENSRLPLKGSVFYVRDYRNDDGTVDLTAGGDGSSWATAINGNAIYHIENGAVLENGHKVSTTDSRYTAYYDMTHPYGESSNASKPFWEANNNKVNNVYRITNTREEQYVGGLQYAVEMTARAARAANKCLEVWVAGGTYTDYKGFVIRDSVSVKGGFPNVELGSPGENERRPLLAQGVPLNSNSRTTEEDIPIYETILQIQPQAPVTVDNAVQGGYKIGVFQNNMRKTVLYQPDVCLPTLAPLGGTYAHGSSASSNDENAYSNKYRSDYLHYNGNPVWDGFTIRHGFIAGLSANRDGGAGVRMFQGVTIRNCVIRNNANFADIPLADISYDRTGWSARASSEYYRDTWFEQTNNRASQLLDGNRGTFWHSNYDGTPDRAPFIVEIDMQEEKVLNAVYWVQRTDGNNNGKIQSYRIYVTSNSVENLEEVANLGAEYLAADISNASTNTEFVSIPLNQEMRGRYVYVYITQGVGGFASGSEFYASSSYFASSALTSNSVLGNGDPRSRGGGVYCDSGESHDGAIENCFIYNNVTTGYADGDDSYGGGMYMISGTGYNLLVSNNYAQNNGGGIFIEDATFYNNTVAYNGSQGTGGMHQYTASSGTAIAMNVFNTLFYGNSGVAINAANTNNMNPLRNCYVQTRSAMSSEVTAKILTSNGNMQGTGLANPFEYGSNALANNNYRLSGSSLCINAGLNEPTDPNDASKRISLPLTDVDFADRIQDCTIDIGAYEYNGAYGITPGTENLSIGGESVEAHVYYVTYSGADGGNASADSPENAACWMKLQQVLDAAGRQKKQNPTVPCVVKVAGSKTPYAPRRTTVVPEYDQMIEEDEDVRSYALIVPRGVEVWGGYDETFTEGNRDIIGNKTIFKAEYVSAADTSLINTYHAVVFTDLLYDENGDVIRNTQTNAYDTIPASAGYAVLDGLYISGGNADGSLREDDSRGGGVLAESYVHVRNCIVEDNAASGEGGGIYLKPGAVVSGTLVTGNTAARGAGIYLASEGDGEDEACLIATTIAGNDATDEGGGLYFLGRKLIVNSTVLWGNTANYAKDVYGNYGSDEEGHYLFSYAFVENLQVPGLNNRSVSADNSSGVRFVMDNPADPCYMIEETSVLAGAGMPQTDYYRWVNEHDLHLRDFADMYRVSGDNIDVGARSLGREILPPEGVLLQRIFVTNGSLLHPDLNRLLAAGLSGDDAIYQTRGSSFVYPMYELHDALRYIKSVRDNTTHTYLPGVDNKNITFEIFLSGGSYIPREAGDGTTVENARTSTFTVPEGVAIYGGFSGSEMYCQDSDGGDHAVTGSNGFSITFTGTPTDDLLLDRTRADLNGNSIIEPWEFAHQTIFSGRSNSELDALGVYHVIYACADPAKVGTLPDLEDTHTGLTVGKPIVFDGITVTGGHAADLLPGDATYAGNYYKGGAICVDGTDNDGAAEIRRIPLTIRRSLIYGNEGVLGGAIYNTGICSISGSQVSGNEAIGDASVSGADAGYVGSGGALFVDGVVYAVNTLFANNEAYSRGGAIFNESNSRIWMVNCNVVRNKAAEYPCIYSLNANSAGSVATNLTSNLIFNTAFWGNEAGKNRYTINKWQSEGVPFDDPSSEAAPDILHFCAYEEGWDKTSVIGDEQIDSDADVNENLPDFKNNNVVLTPDNRSLYGPNFANPSTLAGVAGYQQDADWSLSRINPMVDAGWGWAVQEYDDVSDSWQWPNPANTGGFYFAIPLYIEAENITIYDPLLPGIEDTYMKSHDGRTLTRVCLDPNKTLNEPGHNTYIDIGVYEYQHIPLNTDADTLYVCAEELPGSVNDGSSWETATSNLQRAIERLVLNRNGKDKILYMTEGDFAPIYTISKNGGFVIDTRYGSSGTTTVGVEKNVSSLRIAGGYNADNQRQPIPVESPLYRGENYKTIITSINKDVSSLFNIEDVANRQGNEQDETSDRPVIPIQIENITFENPYGAAFRYATSNGTDNAGALKLTLSGCEFRGGNRLAADQPGEPVVKITGRGGKTLIYNTVFHSNKGIPLDAVDTEVLNATFALNTQSPVLSDSVYESSLYNSVLWRNGGAGTSEEESQGITAPQLLSVETGGYAPVKTENIAYNAIQNLAATTLAQAGKNNDDLSQENTDVISGPNFENPFDGDVTLRNFDIGASAVLLNKGDSVLYRTALGLPADDPSGYDITLNDLRVYDENIDRGAYENNQRLYSVLYVQPGKTVDGDGTTWERAFGQGRLQEAIDLCAVYVATRNVPGETATVFVKSGRTNEEITLHDGVSVYGSVQTNYTDTVTAPDVSPQVTVADVAAARPGLLASSAPCTVIEGVVSGSESFDGMALLDGFEITSASGSDAAPVSLADGVVMRNSYVHGFTVAGNDPVVRNDGGLLYNVLVAANIPAAGEPVMANNGGTLVNVTVDAPENVVPVTHANNGAMFNTLATSQRALYDPLYDVTSPMPGDGNPYNTYLADELSFQLKEMGKAIDAGDADPAIPQKYAGYVDFDNDRDILGNARIFGAAVDYGCFETWNIKGGYKASQAPAAGSVVYVHDGNLVLENLSTTFAPGYLLLKEGTSLYGNGNAVSLAYVAVERTFGAGWQLAAFPYALQRDSISRVAYDGTTYAPARLAWGAGDTIAIYDGRGRAESLTRYHASNSPYWVEETVFDAGEGFGLCLTQAGTYRFTGRDANAAIYTETNTDKTVSLTQHNLTEVESDGKPRFTHKENMGWNLFGIPYLVASYDFADMDLPHLLYDYDGSTYNPIESWTGGQAKLGDGYFTQTAIIGHDEKESLLFPQPQSTSLFAADNTGMNLSLRIKGEAGADKVLFRTTRSSGALTYEVGRDGIKFMSMNPAVPQIYIDNPSTGTRFSLAAAVDEAAYTSVGVSVADSGFYTIDLPEETLAENYDVIVLIDNRTGQATDLKESAYTFFASSAEDDPQRFSLAFRLSETTETPWKVYLHDHVLYVLGLEGGERIYLYDMSGHCLLDTTGTALQFATPVDGSGLYIVDIVSSKARRSFKVIAD